MTKCLNIAHRGAKAYYPENTLLSFQQAIEMGADAIELDVHLSNDGEIMVIHDETVDRTTNGFGIVNQLSLVALKSFQITDKQYIPTLNEVFDLVNRQCLINIELKSHKTTEKVIALIEHYVSTYHWKFQDFLVSSFDWNALKVVSKYNPNIPIGLLTATDLDVAINFAKTINAYSIHPYFGLLTIDSCNLIRQNHLKNFTWTVNEINDIEQVINFGVDGIISDFPDRVNAIQNF